MSPSDWKPSGHRKDSRLMGHRSMHPPVAALPCGGHQRPRPGTERCTWVVICRGQNWGDKFSFLSMWGRQEDCRVAVENPSLSSLYLAGNPVLFGCLKKEKSFYFILINTCTKVTCILHHLSLLWYLQDIGANHMEARRKRIQS